MNHSGVFFYKCNNAKTVECIFFSVKHQIQLITQINIP